MFIRYNGYSAQTCYSLFNFYFQGTSSLTTVCTLCLHLTVCVAQHAWYRNVNLLQKETQRFEINVRNICSLYIGWNRKSLSIIITMNPYRIKSVDSQCYFSIEYEMIYANVVIKISEYDFDSFLYLYKDLKEKNFINDNFMYHYNVHFSPSIHMIL